MSLQGSEYLVAGLIVVCVVGPICIVLLTQNLLDSADELSGEHFDFDALEKNAAEPPAASGIAVAGKAAANERHP